VGEWKKKVNIKMRRVGSCQRQRIRGILHGGLPAEISLFHPATGRGRKDERRKAMKGEEILRDF